MKAGTLFALLVLFTWEGAARAQQPIAEDVPAVVEPKKAETKDDINRKKAVKLFGRAMLAQKQDRLLEALTDYEKALQLDPQAIRVSRALVPLYLALGRPDDAVAACKKTLDIDPGDCEIWFLYARFLRDRGQVKDALAALERGVACTSAAERPDLLLQMEYDRGTLYEQEKDWAKAETAFKQAVKIMTEKEDELLETGPFLRTQLRGERARTWERLGQVCVQAKKYAQAVNAFISAQKADPDSTARLAYNLAEVYLAQGSTTDALRSINKYLETRPLGTGPYELKISILKKLNRSTEIVPELNKAAQDDPHNVPLQLLLARELVQLRQYPQADSIYKKQHDDNPTADVYKGWFNRYKEQPGKMVEALTLLDDALKKASPSGENAQPDASAAIRAKAMLAALRDDRTLVKAFLDTAGGELRRGQKRAPQTWNILGILAARTKQLDVAENLFRACLQNMASGANEHDIYSGLLDVLLKAHKYDDVIKIAKEGLDKAQFTNRIMFHQLLAEAYLHQAKFDEAIAEADNTVKLAEERNGLATRKFHVHVLARAEKYDEAEKECQALLKEMTKAEEKLEVRTTLSTVYTLAGKHDKAEEQLRIVLEAEPNDAEANNNLGYNMADQGRNLDEAEQMIRKAIEIDERSRKAGKARRGSDEDDNAAYLDSLGWVLFRQGKLEEAKQWLEKASSLSGASDSPDIWDHLGDVYYRMKDVEHARSSWEKAVHLWEVEKTRKTDDHYKETKKKLESLKQQ